MFEIIGALIERARQENTILERNGAVEAARARARLLADLEAAIRELELEALTLQQAALESGYGYSCLQKKIARGDLENVGSKGSPRVRRADLPRKGGYSPRALVEDLISRRLAGRQECH